jgi:cell division septation protein DedD
MVGEVNKIIYNMLVSGRGVYLPDVGSLYIERQAARKISADKLLSPRNVVAFQSGEQAPSLVNEIVAVAGCSVEQAADIYQRWSAKTREGSNIKIGGVGVLNHKSFVMESEFASAINPKGVKTIVIRRRSNTWLYAICAVCVLVALGFCGYMMFGGKQTIDAMRIEPIAKVVEQPAATDAVAQGVEGETTTPADSTNSASGNTVASTNASTQPAQPTETVANSGADYEYYVVMGIFSTEENAQRAIAQAESRIKDVSCKVLPFKDKFMVTLFGSDKIGDCNAFANSYRDIYADLWVYKKK